MPKPYGIKFFIMKCVWDRWPRKELWAGNAFNLLWLKKQKTKLKIQIVMLVYIGINSKKLGLVVYACNLRSWRG